MPSHSARWSRRPGRASKRSARKRNPSLGGLGRSRRPAPKPRGGPVITSTHNRRVVKAVRLKKRAMREKDRRFLVEGSQAVTESLASGAPVREVFYTAGSDDRLS